MRIVSQRASLSIPDELPVVQASLRKGRGTRDQIANIQWIVKKAREFQKNICVQVRKQQLELHMEQQTGSR